MHTNCTTLSIMKNYVIKMSKVNDFLIILNHFKKTKPQTNNQIMQCNLDLGQVAFEDSD